MDSRFILITLLIRLGVSASLAAVLGRSHIFKRLIFVERRTMRQNIYLILMVAVPLALGVYARTNVKTFVAGDISYEAAILLGVMGGRFTGAVGGALMAVFSVFNGEFLSLPFNVVAGLVGGWMRRIARDREAIWSFSPFIDISIYRWIKRRLHRPHVDWQTAFFLVVVVLELARAWMHRWRPEMVFALDSPQWLIRLAIYASAVGVVAIPIKIWNNARIELKLEEQARLLLQARFDALQSQINPHFLFNTLNSVTSLVRLDPDKAREVVQKLSNILRRLLRRHEPLVQLRDEVEFTDDFLDIEVIRFGPDKLHVHKELDPASLDVLVPNMLLQPLVENSIKHGLAPKIEGGSIIVRSSVQDGRLTLEVEDDGVGLASGSQAEGAGIGIANISERLAVLYGDAARLSISGRDGEGTRVRIELPILTEAESMRTAASVLYETRSSTDR